MRRIIAITAALALTLVVASTPPVDADVVDSVTIAGEITFWDDWECVPEFESNPPSRCFTGSTRVKGFPVGLWAPAAPECGGDPLCATPDRTINWVFQHDPDGGDTCAGLATPATLDTGCEVAAIGNLDFATFELDGPWCGWGGSDHARGQPVRVGLGGEDHSFQYLFPVTTNHAGPVFVWEIREWDGGSQTGPTTGTMTMWMTGVTDGSCGLQPPEFAPSHGYEVAINLTWVDQ